MTKCILGFDNVLEIILVFFPAGFETMGGTIALEGILCHVYDWISTLCD